MSKINEKLIAHYEFNNPDNLGYDSSKNQANIVPMGTNPPELREIAGRKAVYLTAGPSDTSYFELPDSILTQISDDDGFTLSAWVFYNKMGSPWQRLLDMGSSAGKPNFFITRNLRAVCFENEDLAADPGKPLPLGEWVFVTVTITGTKAGTVGNAGPCVYVNGELANDGKISQTTSGRYGALRRWFENIKDTEKFPKRYIGKSMYEVDENFGGAISDMRMYNTVLTQDEIIESMCSSLTDEDILNIAKNKYLTFPQEILTENTTLPTTLFNNRVNVKWTSSDTNALSCDGVIGNISSPKAVTLSATLTKGEYSATESKDLSVIPNDVIPYTLDVFANKKGIDISKTLYGIFFEDINNSADGGIYAELVQNRSFENFTFKNYDHTSGENGMTEGRVHNPLYAWFGDTDKLNVQRTGGLNEFFNLNDPENNGTFVTAQDGAVIFNRGFCDNKELCSMNLIKANGYEFTIWAKSENGGTISVVLCDDTGKEISNKVAIGVDNKEWGKFGSEEKIILTPTESSMGQLKLEFNGSVSIDMVSLFPQKVWGATNEDGSASANKNYLGNPNYRLRKDLVQTLKDLKPSFLRFPGGCISEGSYIWDNVYDWKDSVGEIEIRKENFNVWGYVMTMGLGYMEYFQLAEDLNAEPLPVMACGVLCQARSDYANPAGGALRDKYIKNFTDLIDFAISTDFENNEWAALRRDMGHEAPFGLHYLGVGNENWGSEFMANFEIFYKEITDYVKKNYPDHELNILSTAGAQADDIAYKKGWEFLAGYKKGNETIAFSDGVTSKEEEITWYKNQSDYMETIVDEHYYRSNNYLLNNADRYNYYKRAYKENGVLDNNKTSKVFVGEYASTDKNTEYGAVAEAACMTGFERNSDVVRLAAYAPLFNKVLNDAQYRWTPDLIWFDNESVWRTPSYYIQKLFANNLGTSLVNTNFKTYENGKEIDLIPRGGILLGCENSNVTFTHLCVTDNTGKVLVDSDLTSLPEGFEVIKDYDDLGEVKFTDKGMVVTALTNSAITGIYTINKAWTNYKVSVKAIKSTGDGASYVGVGLTSINKANKNVTEYMIGKNGNLVGARVFKNGIEGYKLGDFAASDCAGNLRDCIKNPVADGAKINACVDFGCTNPSNLVLTSDVNGYATETLDYKLEAYNDIIFNSVTRDDSKLYIKLVNTDNYKKSVLLNINDANVKKEAVLNMFNTTAEHVHTGNVNTKQEEIVTLKEENISFHDNKAVITLPANSVACINVCVE